MIKRWVKAIATKGILQDFFMRLKRCPIVLLFHGITERPITDPVIQLCQIPANVFEEQIRYLSKNYEVIPIDCLYSRLMSGHRIDSRYAIITFDDGYKNVLTTALPILQKYKMPFTLFVNTGNITTQRRFDVYMARVAIAYTVLPYVKLYSIDKILDLSNLQKRLDASFSLITLLKRLPQERVRELADELALLLPKEKWEELDRRFSSESILNWEEVTKLYENGATIGSHSVNHAVLHNRQPLKEIIFQIKESKAEIEDRIGWCDYFSYSSGGRGDIGSYVPALLNREGYLMAFTSIFGGIEQGFPIYRLPRIPAPLTVRDFKFSLGLKLEVDQSYKKWKEVSDELFS